MLQVTHRAAAFLREARGAKREDAEKTFRRVECHGGFGLAFDTQNEGDQVFRSGDRDVLIVSPELAGLLSEVTIDVEDTPEGRGLTFSTARMSESAA